MEPPSGAILLLLLTLTLLRRAQSVNKCDAGERLHLIDQRCYPCPVGKYQSLNRHALVECRQCSRGTFSDRPGAKACSRCAPAHFIDVEGAKACSRCTLDTYREKPGATSAADCLSCSSVSAFMMTENRVNGSSDRKDCVCQAGKLDMGTDFSDPKNRCQNCPEGALCDHIGLEITTVDSIPNFWRPSRHSDQFYRCLSEYSDCTGGGSFRNANLTNSTNASFLLRNFSSLSYQRHFYSSSYGRSANQSAPLDWQPDLQCAPGHTGPVCSVCLSNWVRDRGQSGQCIDCSSRGGRKGAGPTLALAAGCFFFLFFISSVAMTCPVDSDQEKLKTLRRWGKVRNHFKILLGFTQVMTNLDWISWPPGFRKFLEGLFIFNLDLNAILSVSVDPCAFTMPFIDTFLFQVLLLPCFIGTIYLAFYFRATFMKCMGALAKTKCCKGKLQVSGDATLQRVNAINALRSAEKRKNSHKTTSDLILARLTKKVDAAASAVEDLASAAVAATETRQKELAAARIELKEAKAASGNSFLAAIDEVKENVEEKKDAAELEAAATKAQVKVDALVEAEKTAIDMAKVKSRLLEEALTTAKEALAKMKAQVAKDSVTIDAEMDEAKEVVDELKQIELEIQIEDKASRDRLVFWINTFIFLIFPSLTIKIFKLFDCTRILGKLYLTADLAVECWTGNHLNYTWLGYLMVAVYVFGLPVYTGVVLHKNKASLFDTEHPDFYSTRRRYGGLFTQFEPEYWYVVPCCTLSFSGVCDCGCLALQSSRASLSCVRRSRAARLTRRGC